MVNYGYNYAIYVYNWIMLSIQQSLIYVKYGYNCVFVFDVIYVCNSFLVNLILISFNYEFLKLNFL